MEEVRLPQHETETASSVRYEAVRKLVVSDGFESFRPRIRRDRHSLGYIWPETEYTERIHFTRRTEMRTMMRAVLVMVLATLPAAAQFQNGGQSIHLVLPLQSQRAVVTQRVGITDITITYHRPLAKGRQIFGTVVPYGKVWRAGANENTTIEFTDPVSIEGKPLAAGTYGLHMIPGEDHWTVIFSKVSTAWGSFTYDEKEDALRVDVKPQ